MTESLRRLAGTGLAGLLAVVILSACYDESPFAESELSIDMATATRVPTARARLTARVPPPTTRKSFGDGVWRIGTDIAPGTYAAPGGESCLWNSLSGFTGTMNDIVQVGHTGRPIVAIGDTYAGFRLVGFQSFGCGTWRPITDITGPVESIGDGTWLVGSEIEPGTYAATRGCFWERLKGFSGDHDDVIARSDLREEKPVVTIEPTDVGFMSLGCGRWTRIE